eukprot:3079939-Rhodomonas_salina.3
MPVWRCTTRYTFANEPCPSLPQQPRALSVSVSSEFGVSDSPIMMKVVDMMGFVSLGLDVEVSLQHNTRCQSNSQQWTPPATCLGRFQS